MKNNILIIEDDQDIREGIRILLEGEGFAVEEVSNGMEGLKKLSERINLVILKIRADRKDVIWHRLSGIQKRCS